MSLFPLLVPAVSELQTIEESFVVCCSKLQKQEHFSLFNFECENASKIYLTAYCKMVLFKFMLKYLILQTKLPIQTSDV